MSEGNKSSTYRAFHGSGKIFPLPWKLFLTVVKTTFHDREKTYIYAFCAS